MTPAPKCPGKPFVQSKSQDKIRICWTPPPTSSFAQFEYKYTLFYDKEEQNGEMLPMEPTSETCMDIDGYYPEREWNFEVRAENNCWEGPECGYLFVGIIERPGPPKCITTVTDNCCVKMDWFEPRDGGSPITNYEVEVMDSKGKYVKYPYCGQSTKELSCTIAMGILSTSPYNLKANEPVEMRVRACTSGGCGDYSLRPLKTTTHMAAQPGDIAKITASRNPDKATEIEVSWDAPLGG